MKLWETDPGAVEKLVERFTAGEDVRLDERLWRYDVLGSIAHARVLQAIGVLAPDELQELEKALRDLLQEPIRLGAEDEDVHTKLENRLVARLGALGEKLHTGRSRNDQVLTALRLYTKDHLFPIVQALLALAERLLELARRHTWTPMPGYTHTRPASLSSVGLWAGAFVEALLDDLEALEGPWRLLDRSPSGAAAGYGVPLPLDRELAARLLGFSGVQGNVLAVMDSRGKL